MGIDETIGSLARLRQSIDKGIRRTITRPDALVADLNELYIESSGNRGLDELFEYDDVGDPSVTLRVNIDVEFDLKRVMEKMRTRLHATQPGLADEMGNTGIAWSSGRYDFVYDEGSGLLRISHQYSHKRVDTKSVLSIIKRMMDYALDYLKEVKASAKGSTGAPGDRMTRDSHLS